MDNREKNRTSPLKAFWTTEKTALSNRSASSKARSGRFRQRLDRYIFRRAIQAQGFETETHHCANSPWYENTLRMVEASALPSRTVEVDTDGFDAYLEKYLPTYESTGYVDQYGGRNGYFCEKAIEHFLSIQLLRPTPGDKVLDIASWGSPASRILSMATGATCYEHDLTYETDFANRIVSGPAEALEAPDGFFDALMAHCAIDNFEGQSDTWLFGEAARVLKPGGVFLVIPLHLADRAENLVALGGSGVEIDPDTYLVVKPSTAARFCRHYSITSLQERIVDAGGAWAFEIVVFRQLPIEKYPSTRNCRFALRATKRVV